MEAFWARRTPSVFTPHELYLTENLNQFELMPATSFRSKFRIAMDLFIEGCPGPYFFFQVLNDRSPEGKHFNLKIRIFLVDNLY